MKILKYIPSARVTQCVPWINIHTAARRGLTRATLAFALSIVALGSAEGFAQSTNTPATLDYSAFKIIAERNIFNPNRRPSGPGRTRVAGTQPASRVESFTLVGLMEFEKGTFAFFDGTSPGYHKTLQASGEIAGYKLALVNPRLVKLVEGTNVFELQVGQQMRREDESDWFVADENGGSSRRRTTRSSSRGRIYDGLATGTNDIAGAGAAAATDATTEPEVIVVEPDANATRTEGEAGATAPAENGAPADAASDTTDPVLRRLIERRQQELNR